MRSPGRDFGFTLVELMVVVLIIGVLVAVAVPVFTAARDRSELNTCLANQRTIMSAIQAYQANTGKVFRVGDHYAYDPGNWSYLWELDPSRSGSAFAAQRLIPDYLKSAPRCRTVVRAFGIQGVHAHYILSQPLPGDQDSVVSVWGDNRLYGWVGPPYADTAIKHYGLDSGASPL